MKLISLERKLQVFAFCLLVPACVFAAKPNEAEEKEDSPAKQPSQRLLRIILEDDEKEMGFSVACANSRVAPTKDHASRPSKKGDDGTNEVSVELSRPEVDFTFFGSFKEAGKDSILLTFVMSVSMPEFEVKTQGTAFLEPGKPALAFNSGNRSVTLFLEKPE